MKALPATDRSRQDTKSRLLCESGCGKVFTASVIWLNGYIRQLVYAYSKSGSAITQIYIQPLQAQIRGQNAPPVWYFWLQSEVYAETDSSCHW